MSPPPNLLDPKLWDRHCALKDEKYSWSSRSDHTIVSNPSESSLFGLSTTDKGIRRSMSHQNLNTPTAWEAMYKLADARLVEAAAEHERIRESRLKHLSSKESRHQATKIYLPQARC